MSGLDYKKDFKDLYLPKGGPSIIEVPPMRFAMIDGEGNPNGEAFAVAVNALYSFSYTVKMSYKSNDVPQGYGEYAVFPLEGVWDLVDRSKPAADKSNLAYTIMIRQPEFLTESLFERFLSEAQKKKPNGYLEKMRYGVLCEGLCCQMLHLGSYDSEPASFEIMERFCRDHGYGRRSKTHREIYLSDPRRTAADKRKTVLRYPVRSEAQ